MYRMSGLKLCIDIGCGQTNMGFKVGGLVKVTFEYAVAAVGRGQ